VFFICKLIKQFKRIKWQVGESAMCCCCWCCCCFVLLLSL